ncbi:hypothetical protein [Mesorhizobium sp. LNJC384A00]|uniref:hypothetical protein n=1 Tax=Mesorhizobium sp. LNJC384A00 TaxID=1287268 RepID=UPI001FD9D426|nr:hypothetical protein [Mesorhizobium sp. LNJC384A00]
MVGQQRQHGEHRQHEEGAPQTGVALWVDLGVAAKKRRSSRLASPTRQQSGPEQEGAKQAKPADGQEHHRSQRGWAVQHVVDPAPAEISVAEQQIRPHQTSQSGRQQRKRKQPFGQPVHRTPLRCRTLLIMRPPQRNK